MKNVYCITVILLLFSKNLFSQSYTWGNVAFGGGGYVSGIITHKTSGDVYCRTDVGGAYRWDATDSKWIPLLDWCSDDEITYQGVEAIAIDPQNANNVYILAGTSYFNWGRTAILKSTDKGNTFTEIFTGDYNGGQFTAHGNRMGRSNGERLAVDPNNSNILFCGTGKDGLWKSTDAGLTWTLAWNGVTTTPNENGICFVVFDPGNVSGGITQTIYLGVSRFGSTNVYRSINGGASFSALSASLPTTSLMPHRAALNGNMLYITYANGAGPGGHWDGTLNEPCDNGQVWSFNTSTSAATNITPVTGRAYSGVCVDPANANRIVVSTINRWDFQFGNAWGDYVYLSTDGGSTWIQKLSSTSTLNTNGMDWVTGNAIHWAGSIEFDPLNTAKVRIISGNGLFTCDDINAAATTWKFDSKGIEETVALDAISIPGGNFISAVGDVWGAVYSDIYAYPAQKIMPTVICNTGVAYAANNTSKVVRVTDKIYYSTDQGATWTQSTSINGTYGKVALSADGNTILHCPEATTTYYSTNNGGTWTSTGVTNVDRAVPVADFVNTNKFYIYSRASGQLLVSTNKGVSFTASTSNPGQWGSQLIRAVPGNEGHVWVALYGSGLKYTTNNGTSWTTVSNITYCTAVGFGKTEPSATYPTIYIWGTIGGVDGIYRSIDQGVNWTRINDDAHEWGGPGNGNFVMGDMNVYGRVYMSTVGRGIVVGELSGPQPLTANAGTDVTICQGNSTTLSGSASEGTGGPYTYSWSPSTGLSSTSISNPVASPTSTTTYTLTANDGTSTATDQVVVTVNPLQSLPIAEGFESATFPSTGWTLSGNNSFTRNTSCTAATGSGSIVASTFGNSTLGNTYELTTPLLSFPSATSTTLSFKYATMFYDQGGTNNDRYDNLSVWISTTCGGTYSKIWDQSTGGVTSTIASSAGDNSVFCPSNSANDWDAESVDLSAYDGGTIGNGVQLKFVVTNGHGTNVYLDDINISNVGAVSTSITLLNFNAVKNGSEVDIKWQTATEINNDYFTVEKSLPAGQAGKNGIDFTTVDIVDGAGNSQSILNYQTTDRFPYNGISYYRLKQVDYDGTVSYSEIVAVNFNDHKNITVYPNPGTGIFNIEGLGTESEITVDNPLGQTILIKRTFSDSSEIDLRDQLSGVYYIKINNGDSSVCTKIIIHR